jgi:hypothetical protein
VQSRCLQFARSWGPPGQDAGSSSLIDLFGYVADTNPYRLMMLHGPGAGAEPARNLLENAAISEI